MILSNNANDYCHIFWFVLNGCISRYKLINSCLRLNYSITFFYFLMVKPDQGTTKFNEKILLSFKFLILITVFGIHLRSEVRKTAKIQLKI